MNGERLEDSLRRNYEVRVEDQLLLSIIIMHVREARTFQNMYEFTKFCLNYTKSVIIWLGSEMTLVFFRKFIH